ncbi:MAG TPA: CBS domain-containing protein [Burkholderiales bacterium]|nr:CBS domain-containing protein [Burkholderiales bacterium]
MAIGDVCNRDVVFIHGKRTVADASRLMRAHHVGCVVVVDDELSQRPVGMFTDRDVAVGVVALGLDPELTVVATVMRPGVACVLENESLARAVALMRDQGVRRLPVVDAAGRLAGLIAADDLLDILAGEISDLAVTVSRGIGCEARERLAAT